MLKHPELEKLGKLLGLLGSDHPGERDAAARAAHAFIKKHATTWPEILGLGEAPPPHLREVDELLHYGQFLSDWERSFVAGIASFKRLSPGQRRTLNALHAKVAYVSKAEMQR